MPISVTYFSYGEIKNITTDNLVFSGDKVLLGQRVTVPYAMLIAIDEGTGEILKDLLSRMSGQPAKPAHCWQLRCLDIYPALLCLRVIGATFRGGTKPRHYLPAAEFAERQGQSTYSADELSEFLCKTYKCDNALYLEILKLIPVHQTDDFIVAAWRITKLNPAQASEQPADVIELLKHCRLLPPDEQQLGLFS